MLKKSKTAKVVAGVLGFAMAFSFVFGGAVAPAQAQSVEDLTAQVNSLLALIAQLQSQLAGIQGGSTGTGASMTFVSNLTIGSTGAEVTALQQFLVSKGHLQMPAGVAYGYFGPLTRSAVAAYQAANGIAPAVGYFGPLTRASVNAMGTTPTTPVTPGTTPGTGITTPGAEGVLTVELNPTPSAGKTIREGATEESVIGLKIKAQLSDLSVQRVKLNLGTASSIYTKTFKKLYLTDGSNVLAEVDLNSSTVVKEGSNYFVTITGFNVLVSKDQTKVLTVKADLHTSIETGNGDGSKTVTVPINGVRAVDGAGLNQEAPSAAISRTVTIEADSFADDASLKLSLNTNTPDTTELVAADGSDEDELDEMHTLSFDLRAEKDSVLVTDLSITVSKTGSGAATATTAYLYESGNSTPIGSATIDSSTGVATFSDVDFTVPKDTTKTYLVKVDIRDANGTSATITTTVTSGGFTAENSEGSTVTPTGSATGDGIILRNVGPIFTLISQAINKSETAAQNNTSTSTAKATFTVKVKAVGGDIAFGTVASGSPMFGTSTTFFKTYQNGAAATLLVASSTSYSTPSSGVTTTGTNSFQLQENNEITIPVDFLFEGRTTAGVAVSTGSYAIALEGIQWTGSGVTNTSTFMAGETNWRTSSVSLP